MRIKVLGNLRTRWSVLIALATSLGLTVVTQVQAQPFKDRKVNVNLPVGTIAGSHGVSNGAATYSIPIPLPPGRKGLVPSLSVNYNSLSTGGLIGRGWSISGISAITRQPKNFHNDGRVESVRLTTKDILALNGNRLVAVNGEYGVGGTEYKQEIEKFNRITSHGKGTHKAPKWFKVESKQGITMELGNSDDSRIIANSQNPPLSWMINKVYDNYGNHYTYHYRSENNETLLDKIKYNDNIVQFNYTPRKDKNKTYVGGQIRAQNVVLKSIVITNAGKQVDRYDFNYSFNFYSYLKEIKKSGSKGTPLNSTVFEYGESGGVNIKQQVTNFNSIAPNSYLGTLTEKYNYWAGDFNGDGVSDILRYGHYSTFHETGPGPDDIHSSSGRAWTLHLGNAKGGFHSGIKLGFNFPAVSSSDLRVGDFNGDGKDDFVLVELVSMGLSKNNRRISPYISTGKGFKAQKYWNTGLLLKDNDPFTFHVVDFDGDGKLEMFYFAAETVYSVIVNCDINDPRTKLNQYTKFPGPVYQFEESFPDDFDGDGVTELINVRNDEKGTFHYVRWNGQKLVFHNQKFKLPSASAPKSNAYTKTLYGDFNGDGKLDNLKAYYNSPFGFSLLYPGTGRIDKKDKTGVVINLKSKQSEHYVSDINGDGKSDIVEVLPWNIYVYYSNGLSFQRRHYALPSSVANKKLVFGDFNGDGAMDLMAYKTNSGLKPIILHFYQKNKERLLRAVADGYNNITEFTYEYLTNSDVYKKGSGAKFPLTDIQPALPVVSFVSVPNGIGGRNTTSYKYEGAKVHKHGRGFLGYSKITEHNFGTDTKTETKYQYDPTYFINQPYQISTWLIGTGQALSQTNLWNRYKALGGKRVWPYVLKSKSVNKLLDFTTTVDYKYDDFGNVRRTKTTKGDIENVIVTSKFEKFGAHVPSKLTRQRVITRRKGQQPYVRRVEYEYYNNGGLKRTLADPSSAKELRTDFKYWPDGNLKSKTVSSNDNKLLPRTKHYAYDSQGKFVEKTTNSLGQSVYAKYDPKRGVPLTKKGIDGLITSYVYNEFGQLIMQTTPDNVTTKTSFAWEINNPGSTSPTKLGKSLHTTTVTTEGKPTTKTWFDALGRKIQVRNEGATDNIFQITTYDYRGRVKTTTSPFIKGSGTPILVTTNSYNERGQLHTSTNDIGTTKYKYRYKKSINRITTQVRHTDGTETRTDKDATGKLVASRDESGKFLNYTYHSSGLLKETKMGGKVIASAKYDKQGNQIELVDLNAGTIVYDYDAFGQLRYTKDANGNAFEMEYDVMGRIKQKRDVNGGYVTKFDYVGSGFGINQIQRVKETKNNIIKDYYYDHLGRVKRIREKVDGKSYNTGYGYNKYSSIEKVIYPSGFKIDKIYFDNGFLKEVKHKSTAIWKVGDETSDKGTNAFGQYTKYTLGNGLKTMKSYDKFGFLSRIYVTNPDVQDLRLSYNIKNGNLIKRSENGKVESFEYDNLDRLNSVRLNGKLKQELKYWDNGNIDFKTDAGEYTYDKDKVNAVLTATNPNGDISSLKQDIKYNSFHNPESIIERNTDDNGNPTTTKHKLSLYYGPDRQRKKTVYEDGQQIIKKYFFGEYEKVVNTKTGKAVELHYIAGGDGITAIFVKETGSSDKLYYVYKDQLSSIVCLTDSKGKIVNHQSFDAWGRQRDPKTWDVDSKYVKDQKYSWLRGYTGHEHLPNFGLINMNGRMYDPVLGRMLSPDNYVANVASSQSYNRYSYVFNNPLKYTDPSGESPVAIIAMYAAAKVAGDYVKNDFKMNDEQFMNALWQGTGHGIMAVASGGATSGWDALGGAICNQIPEASITIDGTTVGISPASTLGNGFGYGVNVTIRTEIAENVFVNAGFGVSRMGKAMGTGRRGYEIRGSLGFEYDNGHHGVSIYSTSFITTTGSSQRVGGLKLREGDFSVRYENDGFPFNRWAGDGEDKYRTAAVQIQYLDFTAGFKLFTGHRGHKAVKIEEAMYEYYSGDKGYGPPLDGRYGEVYPNNLVLETGPRYRLGAAYVGYKGFQVGANSAWIRHKIQNEIAHDKLRRQPGFRMTSDHWEPYYNYQTNNPFTLW